jgi:hypothetical protein
VSYGISGSRLPDESDTELVERISRRSYYLVGFANGTDPTKWGKRRDASDRYFQDFQRGYLDGQRAFERARNEVDDRLIAEHKAKKVK